MTSALKIWAGGAALAAALAAGGGAQAAYFVNAVAQVGTLVDGGVQQNGPTQAQAQVNVSGGTAEAYVDMAEGTGRTYLSLDGTQVTTGVTGAVFGDTVTFNGNGEATFSFSIDGRVYSDAADPNATSPMQVFMFATLRVFAAGSGANANNFVNHAGALVSETFTYNVLNPADGLFESINETLSGSLSVLSGGAYDVFASFSSGVALNGHPVFVELDFLNTTTFGIQTTNGVTYSADSGVLVGSVAAVPEPGAWALMILGFGAAGFALRRARPALAA